MGIKINKVLATLIVAIIALGIQYFSKDEANTKQKESLNTGINQPSVQSERPKIDNQKQILMRLKEAANSQQSGWWLTTKGVVIKHLKDDMKGVKHQKFILRLGKRLTLLVAHNIDLAPRIPVKEGDSIILRARYEWNHRGGVLHWTHHDPKGRQKGGWIYFNGQYYK